MLGSLLNFPFFRSFICLCLPFTDQTQNRFIYLDIYAIPRFRLLNMKGLFQPGCVGIHPLCWRGTVFFKKLPNLVPETLSGLTAGTAGWLRRELQEEMICTLHARIRIQRDSLPALLPVRSPTRFLCCVFFSSLTCSVTCFLIHLQAESLLHCHKSDFCSSFCVLWWQSWRRAGRDVCSAAASAHHPPPAESIIDH